LASGWEPKNFHCDAQVVEYCLLLAWGRRGKLRQFATLGLIGLRADGPSNFKAVFRQKIGRTPPTASVV